MFDVNDSFGNGGNEDISMDDVKYAGLEEYLESRVCPKCGSKGISYFKEIGAVCSKCNMKCSLGELDKYNK